MKLLRLFLFFTIFGTFSHHTSAQYVNIDSAQKELENSFANKKLPVLIKLSRAHLSKSSTQVRKYSLQALQLAEQYEDTTYIALSYNYLGASYVMEFSYDTAFNLLYKGLLLAEQINNPDIKVRLYNNIATLYEHEKDYKKAFENYLLAAKTIKKYEITDAYLPRLSLATFYCKLNKYKEADALYAEILKDAISNHNTYYQVLALLSYLESHCSNNQLNLIDQYDLIDSIQSLAKSSEISNLDSRIRKQYISYLFNAADYLTVIDSSKVLLKVEELDFDIQIALHHIISNSYEELHDFSNALYFRKQVDSLNSSRFKTALQKMTKNQYAVYKLANQEIIYNQIQLERKREKSEVVNTKVYINIGIVIIFFLVIIIFYLIYLYENKENKYKDFKLNKADLGQVKNIVNQKELFGNIDFINVPAFSLNSSFMYLYSNDLFLELAEKKSIEALKGSNDFDLKWNQFAENLIAEYNIVQNSLEVRIIDGKYMLFPEGFSIVAIPLLKKGFFHGIQALIISNELLSLRGKRTKEKIIMKEINNQIDKETPSNKKFVLAVDDQTDNLFLIETFLKNAEVNLSTASSGMEAIKLANEIEFDFILMDIKMPEMDGIEAARQIKEKTLSKNSQIYALTASTNNDASIRSKDLFNDVVHKPISKQELYSKLSISLGA